MFRVEDYLQNLIDSTKDEFGDRLLYVGLHGSYRRGEATESSDIDIMVGFQWLGEHGAKTDEAYGKGREGAGM